MSPDMSGTARPIVRAYPVQHDARIFDFFPRLFPEVRLKIWKIAGTEPRLVEITHDPFFELKKPQEWPALFGVSFEASEVAAGIYGLREKTSGFAYISP
jgi:hypothetical protein